MVAEIGTVRSYTRSILDRLPPDSQFKAFVEALPASDRLTAAYLLALLTTPQGSIGANEHHRTH